MAIEEQRRAEFDGAVRDLYDALTAIDEPDAAIATERFNVIQDGLYRMISVRATLDDARIKDAVADAILNFIEAVKTGRVNREGAPAYLTTIALHEAVNQTRRREVPTELSEMHEVAEEDEQINRLLEAEDGHQIIKKALKDVLEDRLFETFRIVMAWIYLARELGRAPSHREAAKDAGVTHPTIAHHLDIFTSYVRRYL
jgi:DNA-directed RNA polymerase specialized sigma24 family protein